MAIIAFYSNTNKPIGKTLSITAVCSYLAVEKANKILLISTSFNDDILKDAFEEEQKVKKNTFMNDFIQRRETNISTGITGLYKLISSNRLNPQVFRDYTSIVYKDRLEILYGLTGSNLEEYEKVQSEYLEIIKIANQVYDFVFVDLDDKMNQKYKDEILKISDVIVLNLEQKLKSINQYIKEKENNEILKKDNIILLLSKCDQYSKYNAKNIARYIGKRETIYTIPYNTLYFEASIEGKVSDYFLKYRNISEEDINKNFIDEVKKIGEGIIYKLQEQQMKR